jgi:hypothetical protein
VGGEGRRTVSAEDARVAVATLLPGELFRKHRENEGSRTATREVVAARLMANERGRGGGRGDGARGAVEERAPERGVSRASEK